MRNPRQLLIAFALCLVLPLQSGLALARTTGMPAVHAPAAQPVPPQLAHNIGQPHQHGAHAQHGHPKVKKLAPAGKGEASHKARHAKAECTDCAKCCLTAAFAPPPAQAPAVKPVAVRTVFTPESSRIAIFIPDGPERPPRALTA